MKLLFPIFVSLMLQCQVNTELFGWKRCLMGLGRCKDHCTVDEKEVQKCKKKKCCIGPKMVGLINNYLQNELLHAPKEDSPKHLNTTKNSRAAIQTKYRSFSFSPQIKSPVANYHLNTLILSHASAVGSARTNPIIAEKTAFPATSTKSNAKRRGSATDSPQPSPPP
ncbi:beta-defensin 129 [Pteronotus mesoamericanus]|uniref:beta-defensin 129 n=1 Tax=Pteronotus mesoamericanus TaxID=1884717 RepID=UPI0023EBCFC7|nr:beta-defensin 129 [Pteronotus parnellii mesoamericanus]